MDASNGLDRQFRVIWYHIPIYFLRLILKKKIYIYNIGKYFFWGFWFLTIFIRWKGEIMRDA